MKLITLILLCSLLPSLSHSKRIAPPDIPPLEWGEVKYSTQFRRNSCQDEGKVAGYQVALIAEAQSSEEPLWQETLYQRSYNCSLETDVQDIHPTRLWLKAGLLKVRDERGLIYSVDIQTGDLVDPAKSVIYPSATAK